MGRWLWCALEHARRRTTLQDTSSAVLAAAQAFRYGPCERASRAVLEQAVYSSESRGGRRGSRVGDMRGIAPPCRLWLLWVGKPGAGDGRAGCRISSLKSLSSQCLGGCVRGCRVETVRRLRSHVLRATVRRCISQPPGLASCLARHACQIRPAAPHERGWGPDVHTASRAHGA
jgi:hypothetical protein